jgi:hypothetical protein
MNYVLDAVLIIVGLVFLIGGVRRGPLAEGLALASIVLGALLMVEWGDVWGTDLAETIPLGSAGVTRFIVWLTLLLAPVVIIGWGGSVLLPRLQPMRIWQRIVGGLLGLANGLALAAFVLRAWYYTGADRDATSGLLADPVALFFLNWAGWWPLVILLGGVGALLAGLISGAFRPQRTTPPLVRPAPVLVGPPSTSSSPAPSPGTPPDPTPRPVPEARPAPEPPRSSRPVEPTRPVPVVPAPPSPAPGYTASPRPASPPTNGSDSPAPPAPAGGSTVGQRCRTCGKPLLPGAAFCTNCGTPVEA